MANNTKIEWTDATWNPIIGCRRVDGGCRNCYAEVMAARFSDEGQWGHGLATRVKGADGATQYRWTGATRFIDHALEMPLRWRKPRKIFVCSTSDLFGEFVPDEWIDKVFAVMALAPHHTFQVLTKRPERARAYMTRQFVREAIAIRADAMSDGHPSSDVKIWPLPNVWLGTSISDQASANLRIPELLATPAAVRFISAEPLLGPVKLDDLIVDDGGPGEWHVDALDNEGVDPADDPDFGGNTIDWVICGGESGQHASPMHPQWARSLRDQCAAAGTAYFFKQWGEWADLSDHEGRRDWFLMSHDGDVDIPDGRWPDETIGEVSIVRVGKKAAGALLDGREHKEFPDVPRT